MTDLDAPTITATGLWYPDGVGVRPWRSNAELIARGVVPLGFLRPQDRVLDPTYGKGVWWRDWQPNELICHDIDGDGVDFRQLPHGDKCFDAVAFDPPYVCHSLDTEIFTTEGWKRYDEVGSGDEVLTLDRDTGLAEWQALIGVGVYPSGGTLVSLRSRSHSSISTPTHRWPVLGALKDLPYQWDTTNRFRVDSVVPTAAPCPAPTVPKWSDALVELVGWFFTEGHIEGQRAGGRWNEVSGYGHICQSRVVNPDNCARIRGALSEVVGPPVDRFPRVGRATDGVLRWRESNDGRNTRFWLSADMGRMLQEHAPGCVPTHDFLLSLTAAQLRLFVEVAMAGDGCATVGTFGQKDRVMAERFQFAAILAGLSTSIREGGGVWTVRLRRRSHFKPSRAKRVEIAVPVDSLVWCPRTANETWLARREGTVYFTGNCVGGRDTSTMEEFNGRYGLKDAPRTPKALAEMIEGGLQESWRVLRPGGILLAKTANYVSSGRLFPGSYLALEAALDFGFRLEDWFVFLGSVRPQPPRTRKCGRCGGFALDENWVKCVECGGTGRTPSPQQHARQNVSYLHVLRRPPLT